MTCSKEEHHLGWLSDVTSYLYMDFIYYKTKKEEKECSSEKLEVRPQCGPETRTMRDLCGSKPAVGIQLVASEGCNNITFLISSCIYHLVFR